MFCDMVGSTIRTNELDPEDFLDLMRSYRRAAKEVVQRFEGLIAQYYGDGILAYFGYPAAHENDPERAIRAALEIVDASSAMCPNARSKLEVRIGIATGLVVVGEQCETVNPGEKSAVGSTPHLAARLQAIAKPSEIVIAESTQRCVGRLFETEELPPITANGFVTPITAFKVLSCSAIGSRFEAFQSDERTPFVGRETEFQVLQKSWEAAKRENGRAVLLSGEAGIGKSRLLDQLQKHLAGTPHARIRYFCSSLHTQSPLYPFFAQVERNAGILPSDSREAKLQKLERILERTTSNLRRDVNLSATMLGIWDRNGDGSEDDAQQKEIIFQAALEHLRAMASRTPLLVVFEDVHWIDPSSNDLLERFVDECAGYPTLIVVTARPEYQPTWLGKSHASAMALNRLGRSESSAIVSGVTRGKTLPVEVQAQILERTDGVPLYIEESTKTIIESGLLVEEADRFVPRGEMPPLAVPPSLQASFVARLDRLASVKDIAQIGAAIGREFSHTLLEAVAALPAEDLNEGLAKLIASGLLHHRGTPPDAIYTFKHALAQDAAYGTLLKVRRQQLHAVIGGVLVKKFPAIVESQPEVVAHHYTEARLNAEAVDFWLKAGKLAGARSASNEAVAHLERGLNVLNVVPPSPERDRIEFKLQLAIWPNLIATKGSEAPETLRAARRSRELLRHDDPFHRRLYVLGVSFLSEYNVARYREGRDVAEELLAASKAVGDKTGHLIAHAALAVTCNATGEFSLALHHANRALDHYVPSQYGPHSWRYMYESGVGSQCHKGLALWNIGKLDDAKAAFATALEMAKRLDHPNTSGYVFSYAGMIPAFLASDFETLKTYATLCQHLGTTHKIKQWEAWGLCFGAIAHIKSGQVKGGREAFEKGESLRETLHNRSLKTLFLAARAIMAREEGQWRDAADTLDRALQHAEESGERWLEAELWRLKGDLLAGLQPAAAGAAESCYRQGIVIARKQQAPVFGLRSSMALISLLTKEGRLNGGIKELGPFYAAFSQGRGTPEWQAARNWLGGH
jgi:class 3 adenylate cyclase/tetratricopeptide (TPR) repeat protein